MRGALFGKPSYPKTCKKRISRKSKAKRKNPLQNKKEFGRFIQTLSIFSLTVYFYQYDDRAVGQVFPFRANVIN
jgi:hypothetical protein